MNTVCWYTTIKSHKKGPCKGAVIWEAGSSVTDDNRFYPYCDKHAEAEVEDGYEKRLVFELCVINCKDL